MELEELRKLVDDLQHRRFEPDAIEAKAARAKAPKKIYDSLSAFANRSGGGVILFGVDETRGFTPVGITNAGQMQETVTNIARDVMEPPLHITFTVDDIDGNTVMAVEVDEVPNEQKPCYYKPKGLKGNGGAYIRSGGTDRAMTDYEIFGYISSRGQPKDDEEVVTEASLDDLNDDSLNDYIATLRQARPGASYLQGDHEEVLRRLHIIRNSGSNLHPTVTGLLIFGKYPQEFFPQLRITFVQFYGTEEGEKAPGGQRFLDNQSFEGCVKEMVERAEAHVVATMRKSLQIDGLLRTDIPEYPLEALREAIRNAVAHRDYSKFVRGSYIQIRMFADRIEIQSPGGLHGNVTLDNLDDEHSTRNERIMRIMEDLHIVENRGSGIDNMLTSLRDANLEPPQFDDRRASFRVTFSNHTLMSPETIRWLNQYSAKPINDRQRLALAFLRQQESINNADYRRLNRVDAITAGNELRELVENELVNQDGFGRWTTYNLKVETVVSATADPTSEDLIEDFVRENESITNQQCRELLEVEEHQAYYLLKKMIDTGRLKPIGVGKGRKYTLP